MMVASQEEGEKAPDEEFDRGVKISLSTLAGIPPAFGGFALGFSSPSFSGVGQMPSCSYKSKKLELVGGERKLMLVDRDRGSSLSPEALRLISPDAMGWVVGAGTGGSGASGAGDSGDVISEVTGRDVEMLSAGADSLEGAADMLAEMGK